MLLKSLKPRNFGSFSGEEIRFESDVTVITGANDTGKSSLLRLLRLICVKVQKSELIELDRNIDRTTSLAASWTEDKDVTVEAKFDLNDQKSGQANINYFLAPTMWGNSTIKTPTFSGALFSQYALLPTAVLIDLGARPGIRDTISLDNPNQDERNLIAVAFGPNFQSKALADLPDSRRTLIIEKAEKILNSRLAIFLPPTLQFQFRLRSHSDKPTTLFLTLEDGQGGYTELTRRGKGIQVLVNLLGLLAIENHVSVQTLLLLDEPETHLHADAQHALRAALEALAETGRFQIVYATHSPCMVNTMRPRSIRLLTRAKQNDRAVTFVENDPFSKSYATVRSSLGISPADSLLFAPITILVEGKTEVLCLPILFEKLSLGSESEFKSTPSLLAQTVLIDAEGCGNIANLARVAKANGANVIAFVDGDRSARWLQQLDKETEKTPVIISKENGEFEEIISPENYFEALKQCYSSDGHVIELADFRTWEAKTAFPNRVAFTKRVARWLTEELGERDLEKALVMRQAVDKTPIGDIDLTGLKKLIAKMSQALKS